MAYDRASASLVLYGLGSDGSPQTWEWTAGTWVERHPPAAPPRFYSFSLGDNEAAGNVIAFGGCCAQDIAPSQTWSWDGSTWKRLQPNTMPIDRVGVNLVYDPAIQKLVLLGGYVRGSGNQSNDLWTWDGERWVREYPPGVIPSELVPESPTKAPGHGTAGPGRLSLRAACRRLGFITRWRGMKPPISSCSSTR